MDSDIPPRRLQNRSGQAFDLGSEQLPQVEEETLGSRHFWQSDRFWQIGMFSVAYVLTSDIDGIMWYRVVGEILQYWFGASASVGILEYGIKAVKK